MKPFIAAENWPQGYYDKNRCKDTIFFSSLECFVPFFLILPSVLTNDFELMKKNNARLIGYSVLLALVWVGLVVSQFHLAKRAFSNQKELFHLKVDDVFEESLERLDTIDFDIVNSYIQKELLEHDITDAYQLGLYFDDESCFLFVSEDADTARLLSEGFAYNLLSISDEEAHLDTLYIFFPHIEQRFHWDVLTGYSMITVLLALLLLCFVCFAIITIRQWRINDFREKMVHSITHELKTPITTISLASQYLLDDSVKKEVEEERSYFRMISDEANSMQHLVDEVLSMFRNSKTIRERSDVMINKLLPKVVEVHRLSLNECKGEVVFDLQAQSDVVFGDLPHLANVFSNLIDNAIKYRREQLVIKISTRNVGDTIEIRVEDNGIGISESDQQFIFEPFARANTNNKHYVKGYGLGLNYVMNIIEYHEGAIKVESELGKGTVFIISLPLKFLK